MANHYINPEESITLHGLFLERVKRSPQAVAYRYFDVHGEAWLSLTWGQMQEQVARWQAALLQENFTAGDRVAVMLRNCPQWIMFEQAALSLGLVVVPMYVVDRPDNIAYTVNHAGVKMLLFETDVQWQDLSTVLEQLGCVQRFVSLDSVTDTHEPRLRNVGDWLPSQATLRPARGRNRDELATIIYTSGTTGKPKGVMLSHHNIVYNAYTILRSIPVFQQDIALSFLPLSHIFERTAGFYFMTAGCTVAYTRSIPLLADDLKFIRPTIMVAVPLIYERIYNTIHAKLKESSSLAHKLFTFTVEVGWERFEYQQGRGRWSLKQMLWPALKRLVASKVMDRLGGRLRFSVSGGAALPPKVARLFIALGLPLLQGYGMTETSPVVSANSEEHNRPSTVGQPLEGIEVRIDEQNTLLVKGPSNMLGYWNNPEATALTIDQDGWLTTGDAASIDANGFITITGRVKEIIVLANGEKVPPSNMEVAILRDRLFDQVMVVGEGRSALAVLAVVNPAQWQVFARQLGVPDHLPESLQDTRVKQQVLLRVSEKIKEFPGYTKVHRVLLLAEPWSIENGLMTPTLKLKRARVLNRYENEITQLYEGRGT
jgi:long-chain acyl-CoA synthetase